ERVPPTAGQRLWRIARALESGLETQIESIELHDELSELPRRWRDVLAHFECAPAEGLRPRATAMRGTDLHRLQAALIDVDRLQAKMGRPVTLEPVELTGDGSVIVVRGVSRDLSAQAIGEYLRTTGAGD